MTDDNLEPWAKPTPKVAKLPLREPAIHPSKESSMSLPKVPVNRTTVRGVVTALAGLATLVGVIPAEAQALIVENAEVAFGAVTTLWGVIAAVKGALK